MKSEMAGMNPAKKRETFDVGHEGVGTIIPDSRLLGVVKSPGSLNVAGGFSQDNHASHLLRMLSRFFS